MKKREKLPQHMRHIYGTMRGFRSTKRQQAREAQQALSELVIGCAYSPAYKEIDQIRELMKVVQQKQSVKRWGD